MPGRVYRELTEVRLKSLFLFFPPQRTITSTSLEPDDLLQLQNFNWITENSPSRYSIYGIFIYLKCDQNRK